MAFHKDPGARAPQVCAFASAATRSSHALDRVPRSAFRAASSLPQALLAARPWQTIVLFQAVIAENEACHGEVMTLHLYENPITPALLPSRNFMAMSAK